MSKWVDQIVNSEVSYRKNTIWYTIGSICSSAASMLLLIFVTRIVGAERAGIFSIAWSASQLMLTIGWYNMRSFQVSDVLEEYAFKDYLTAKVITSCIMVIAGFFYSAISGYDSYKTYITILLCILMIGDVAADVFSGFFQHKERLHIAGKSYTCRVIFYNAVLVLVLWLTKDIAYAIIGGIIASAVWVLSFDVQISRKLDEVKIEFHANRLRSLFKECFPLFIGSFSTVYIVNIPKNAINLLMTNDVQTYYNLIFMPSAVINLFCMFIFVPFYGTIATAWVNGEKQRFIKIIRNLMVYVILLTVFTMLAGWLLGIPVLSLLSGEDLSNYKVPMMIMLCAGGLNGGISVFNYILTVMRKQRVILIIYVGAAVLTQAVTNILVGNYGINGAAVTYWIAMAVICISLCGVSVWHLKRARR